MADSERYVLSRYRYNRSTGELKFTATIADPVVGSNAQLHALSEIHAAWSLSIAKRPESRVRQPRCGSDYAEAGAWFEH